jgi:chemotaxis receptor (MCP) glutamine deamidase CheD
MGHFETLVGMDVPLVRVTPMIYRRKMNLFLKPGEVCISREPAVVTTILGSCIAVTMFNERLKIGGICHALLPKHPPSKRWKEFHYVDSSILYMVKPKSCIRTSVRWCG